VFGFQGKRLEVTEGIWLLERPFRLLEHRFRLPEVTSSALIDNEIRFRIEVFPPCAPLSNISSSSNRVPQDQLDKNYTVSPHPPFQWKLL
jgi:hypothetical protein